MDKRIVSTLILLLLLCFARQLFGREYRDVPGYGLGSTRAEGLARAKVDALEKSIGVMLSSRSLVKNFMTVSDMIISKANGFVKKYEVVSELKDDEGLYHLEITAEISEVLDEIIKDKTAFRFLLAEMGFPSFAVYVEKEGDSRDKIAENILKSNLAAAGFKLKYVSALKKDEDLIARMQQQGVEFLLKGSVMYEFSSMKNMYNIKSMKSMQTVLECQLIDCRTSEIVATATVDGRQAHISENTARKLSLEKCVPALSRFLIKTASEKWLTESSEALNDISISIGQVKGKDCRKIFRRLDAKFRGVESVTDKGYAGRAQKYHLQTYLSAEDIYHFLSSDVLKDHSIELVEKNSKIIIIKLL